MALRFSRGQLDDGVGGGLGRVARAGVGIARRDVLEDVDDGSVLPGEDHVEGEVAVLHPERPDLEAQ